MAEVVHVSTQVVEPRHRLELIGEVLARQLAGSRIEKAPDGGPICCDWQLMALEPGVGLVKGRQSGFGGTRDGRLLTDDDADFSLFFQTRGSAPFSQNGHTSLLTPSSVALIAHARPVHISWDDNAATVLRLPRSKIADADLWDRQGGCMLDRNAPIMQLLEAYVSAIWAIAPTADVPVIASRHLIELACNAVGEALGRAASPRKVHAGRLAMMRQQMERNFADPSLSMARIAATVGISERAGYLVMERAGESFMEMLIALRLDRADERLRAGYGGRILDLALSVGFSDLSHFNRQFRARFGMTPSDRKLGS